MLMNVRETTVDAVRSVVTPLVHMSAVVTVAMSSLEMLEDVQVKTTYRLCTIPIKLTLVAIFTLNNYINTDVNECVRGGHNCSGLAQCVNEIGFFRCTCPNGYRLDGSQTSCIGK